MNRNDDLGRYLVCVDTWTRAVCDEGPSYMLMMYLNIPEPHLLQID